MIHPTSKIRDIIATWAACRLSSCLRCGTYQFGAEFYVPTCRSLDRELIFAAPPTIGAMSCAKASILCIFADGVPESGDIATRDQSPGLSIRDNRRQGSVFRGH